MTKSQARGERKELSDREKFSSSQFQACVSKRQAFSMEGLKEKLLL